MPQTGLCPVERATRMPAKSTRVPSKSYNIRALSGKDMEVSVAITPVGSDSYQGGRQKLHPGLQPLWQQPQRGTLGAAQLLLWHGTTSSDHSSLPNLPGSRSSVVLQPQGDAPVFTWANRTVLVHLPPLELPGCITNVVHGEKLFIREVFKRGQGFRIPQAWVWILALVLVPYNLLFEKIFIHL